MHKNWYSSFHDFWVIAVYYFSHLIGLSNKKVLISAIVNYFYLNIILGTEWELGSSVVVPEIRLELTDSCRTEAEFEWLIFEDDNSLANCSIIYERRDIFYSNSSKHLEQYTKLKNSGTFTIKKLDLGENYSVQIVCGKVHSDVLTFSIEGLYSQSYKKA